MRLFTRPALLILAALLVCAVPACKKSVDKDIVTTASGLKYLDITPGTGNEAKAGDEVDVHYTGWLENGSKFDSSLDRGQPIHLRLGSHQVIPGWEEGLTGMKEGGKRRLIIPPNLAYGPNGRPPVIPPNATLTFEVELVKAETPPPAPPAITRTSWQLLQQQAVAEQGLQITDIKEGKGDVALPGHMVEVHYTGTLEDGAKFDSSLDRDQPFKFPLGGSRVIRGWDLGVPGMKVGGKRKLVIPAALGYGGMARPNIPANSTLIFEIELLGITDPFKTDVDWRTDQAKAREKGLQIDDLKAGAGKEAVPGKTVEVHYTGTLTNGTKFDSSVDKGRPFTFQLGEGRVIRGWDVGVAGMKEGGKRKLIIPAEMAYGPRQMGMIPPNSTLIFEVELLRVY